MIELLIGVCQIANAAQCKNVSLVYVNEALTPMQCAMRAQPEIAKWIVTHPGWRVARYTCRRSGTFARI